MPGTPNAMQSGDIGPVVAPEAVERQVQMKLRDPFIHPELLDFENIGAAPSKREVMDDYGDPANESPEDETDELPAVNDEGWTEATATPVLYTDRGATSDEAQGNTDRGLILRAVGRRVDNCAQRIEKVTVEMGSLAATVIGNDATPMTKEFYMGGLNQFRTMSGSDPGGIAWVMHPMTFGAFVLDLGSAAQSIFAGNTAVAQGASDLLHQQSSGKMGSWLGCDIYTSPNVPTSGAGHAGMLLRTGAPAGGRGRSGSVLKLVWKPTMGQGTEEIRVEVARTAVNSRTDTIGRAWFAVMLRDQDRIAQVVTSA